MGRLDLGLVVSEQGYWGCLGSFNGKLTIFRGQKGVLIRHSVVSEKPPPDPVLVTIFHKQWPNRGSGGSRRVTWPWRRCWPRLKRLLGSGSAVPASAGARREPSINSMPPARRTSSMRPSVWSRPVGAPSQRPPGGSPAPPPWVIAKDLWHHPLGLAWGAALGYERTGSPPRARAIPPAPRPSRAIRGLYKGRTMSAVLSLVLSRREPRAPGHCPRRAPDQHKATPTVRTSRHGRHGAAGRSTASPRGAPGP